MTDSASSADPPPRLELIAPAGDADCARAAVENGADAVYFGLASGYNARARAANFSDKDLPALMVLLHRHGVKGYITLNTLVFARELEDLERKARRALESGVDAVLVQDFGAARLIRALCPEWPVHASTQMSLTSAECLREAESLGVRRVVLPRELSVGEIARIAGRTTVELEAFVHGALCVAYSGQCLTSESFGGRSANRGQCAQACRMPYRLICDGQQRDLGDRKYLLSPLDLAAYDLVPELVRAGVSAFKIEGRLKTAEYVAAATRHYRRAIDAAATGRPADFAPGDVEDLQLAFSRGFSHGWLGGCDHKALVPGRSSANRGLLLGEVRGVRGDRVRVALRTAVKRGDGVVFDGDRAAGDEQGSRVYEVLVGGRSMEGPVAAGTVELAFGRGAIDVGRLTVGQKVWKTDDPELTRRLRKTYAGPDTQRKVDLDLAVEAAPGRPLRIAGRAASGAACRVESPEPLAEATKHALTPELLREQLGRLGGTPWRLRELIARIEGRPMVPLSVLGHARREMVRQLEASAGSRPKWSVVDDSPLPGLRAEARASVPSPPAPLPLAGEGRWELHVLCRSMEQLAAVLAGGAGSVIADFHDLRQYSAAVEAAHAAGARIALATPRIQKPGEIGVFRALARHGADAILARNLAAMAFFRGMGPDILADFSLNATNELTVAWLRRQGARRVTASYDLDRDQLLDLAAAATPEALEVVVYQHMPMFHMEHCVFCAALSPGTNKTDCGRPCDRHEVRLRDHVGMEHPLRADAGCRNTLFNAQPQSAAEIVPLLQERGVRHFRVELLDDAGDEPGVIVSLYRGLLVAFPPRPGHNERTV